MKSKIYISPDIEIIEVEPTKILEHTITEKRDQASTMNNGELDSNSSSVFDEGELNSNSNLWE